MSPDGVILRLDRDGALREVAFTGAVHVRRRPDAVVLQIGEVVLELPLT